MPLKVNIRHLEKGEVELEGQLSAEELDLNSPGELVHVRQPVDYDLTVQMTGHEVLARGKIRVALDCECARCLKHFQQILELENWVAAAALEGEEKAAVSDDCIDLTPYLREDILLEFPQHPLCESECAGLPVRGEKTGRGGKGAGQAAGSSVWSELNKLKFK